MPRTRCARRPRWPSSRARRPRSAWPPSTRGTRRGSARRGRSISTTCSCAWSRSWSARPRRSRWYRGLWKHVLVDEYQDTNRAQYRMIRLLTEEHRNLCVVGDPDQSVYRWRGADPPQHPRLRGGLPGLPDRAPRAELPLDQAHPRASHSAVIANNRARKDKRLWTDNADGDPAPVYRAWDEHEEAGFVAQSIRGLRGQGAEYRDVAVFYRTNAQSRVLEDALRRAGIPYTIVGGVRFYDRREVKDTVAWLRLVVNPLDDVAFRRAVASPRSRRGRTTLDAPGRGRARTEPSAPRRARRPAPGRSAASRAAALEEFRQLVDRLAERRRETAPFPPSSTLVLTASGYREALEGRADGRGRRAAREPRGADRGRRGLRRVPRRRRRARAGEPRGLPRFRHAPERRRRVGRRGGRSDPR